MANTCTFHSRTRQLSLGLGFHLGVGGLRVADLLRPQSKCSLNISISLHYSHCAESPDQEDDDEAEICIHYGLFWARSQPSGIP